MILFLLLLSCFSLLTHGQPVVCPNGCSANLKLQSDNVSLSTNYCDGLTNAALLGNCNDMILTQTGNAFTTTSTGVSSDGICVTYQGTINGSCILSAGIRSYCSIVGSGSSVTIYVGGCSLIYTVTSGSVPFLNVTAVSGTAALSASSGTIALAAMIVFKEWY
jgi:hypothetical protein